MISGLEKIGAWALSESTHTYLIQQLLWVTLAFFANTLLKDAYDLDKTNYKALELIGQVKLQNPQTVDEGLQLWSKAIGYTQVPLEKNN